MKISFLIRALNYGGAQRQLIALANGLQKRGFSVRVIVYYSVDALERELLSSIPLVSLNKRGRWDLLRFYFSLIREIRDNPPDILHSYLGGSNVMAMLARPFFLQSKIIFGIRSSNLEVVKQDLLTRIFYWLEQFLARFATLIIVNSKSGQDYAVQRGFPPDKVKVVFNGINTEQFCPDNQARNKVRKEWNIDADHRLVGAVGRIDAIKDIPSFLQAAALISSVRDDVRFVWVGNGMESFSQELQQMTGKLGLANKLIWAGSREEMAAVYNSLDILVSSSLSEGFSNVIGEAMACGVPCVVTDVGDSANIVGKLGCPVTAGNHQALAVAIQDLLDKYKEVEHEEVRARIVQHFSQQAMIQNTEALLLSLS